MRCLILGADSINCKEAQIKAAFGVKSVKKIIHWDGRNKKLPSLPMVDLIIVLTSFINHTMMCHVKKEAKKRGIKVIYLKRGFSELAKPA